MSTTYATRQQAQHGGSGVAWEIARLLFHWLVACAAIGMIAGLFLLTQLFPGEAVPIMISAFAMLGIGLAGFSLWALAVGTPVVRSTFYGPLPSWLRQRKPSAPAPWFDKNGQMLWHRTDRGDWVRKPDVSSDLPIAAGQHLIGS